MWLGKLEYLPPSRSQRAGRFAHLLHLTSLDCQDPLLLTLIHSTLDCGEGLLEGPTAQLGSSVPARNLWDLRCY
jgi:hypothetical protein